MKTDVIITFLTVLENNIFTYREIVMYNIVRMGNLYRNPRSIKKPFL